MKHFVNEYVAMGQGQLPINMKALKNITLLHCDTVELASYFIQDFMQYMKTS